VTTQSFAEIHDAIPEPTVSVRLCRDCAYYSSSPQKICRREMRSNIDGKVDFAADWGLGAHQARQQYCGVQAIFFQPIKMHNCLPKE
jgi:hypothetical protein